MQSLFNDPNFVSTDNLSVREISSAGAADKLTVIEGGYGFVPKDWLQSLRELVAKRKLAKQPALSPYRKNVKANLIKGLLDLRFFKMSETSFQKNTNFIVYKVTLFDNHFTYLTRERSLRDGWLETRHAYTYQEVRGVIRRG